MEAGNLETADCPKTSHSATVADDGGHHAQCSTSETLVAQASTIQRNSGKQVVVRVKRKHHQAPIDALWLEINDRPLKRQAIDLTRLSLSDSTVQGTAESRKLLFHHVETVRVFDDEKDLLESILKSREGRDLEQSHQERREGFKKLKGKHDQLRTSARQKHENIAKSARFEQVWSRRKGITEVSKDNDIHEIYHLYDVVRVDVEEEMAKKASRRQKAKSEAASNEGQLLCNYLPLIREFLPSAAAEFEEELNSAQSNEQDDYVYDVYTLGGDENVAEEVAADYPLVQVEDDDFYYGDPVESVVDSDDSNDENNPLNDYPEEESDIGDSQRRSSYESEELSPFDKDDEDNSAFIDSDEGDRIWTCRR